MDKFEIKTIDTANNVVSEVFGNRYGLKITKLQDLQEIKDAINYVEDVLKTNFLEEYELGLNRGKYNGNGISMSVTKAHSVPRFDSKSFEKDYPDLYRQYLKDVNYKASVSFSYTTPKKEEENESK